MEENKTVSRKKPLIIALCTFVGIVICVLIVLFVPTEAPARNNVTTSGAADSSSTGAAEQSVLNTSDIQQSLSGALSTSQEPSGSSAAQSPSNSKSLTLTDKSLGEFEKFLASSTVEFDYDNSYDVEIALSYAKMRDYNAAAHRFDIRTNGKVDFNSFYNRIKKNNAAFLRSANGRDHHNYTDKELRKYCQIIVDCVNEMQKKLPKSSVDSLCCIMYDMKVLDYKYDDEGILAGVDPNAYNNFYINNTLTDYENEAAVSVSAESTFYHELIHLIQSSCGCCGIDNGYRGGASIAFNELYLNPTYWGWLIEATAELNASELAGCQPEGAFEWIEYARWLNLILAMNGDKADYRMQDIDLNKSLEYLFKVFDLKTAKEREEFVKMMYSAEIVMNTPYEFKEWYSAEYNVYGEKLENKMADVCYDLKGDVLHYTSKLFYRSLAREINAGNVTKGDAFYMIRVFDSKVKSCAVDDNKEYAAVRNEFFKTLSKDNGMVLKKINTDFENAFVSYDSLVNRAGTAPLSFLTPNQRKRADEYYRINMLW